MLQGIVSHGLDCRLDCVLGVAAGRRGLERGVAQAAAEARLVHVHDDRLRGVVHVHHVDRLRGVVHVHVHVHVIPFEVANGVHPLVRLEAPCRGIDIAVNPSISTYERYHRSRYAIHLYLEQLARNGRVSAAWS